MGGGPTEGSPGSRIATLLSGPRALVALALLQIAIAVLVWSPFPGGIWHDDGVYLLLGRALAEGEGLRYHGVAGSYPAPKFPPLYPWTLAGLWSLLADLGSVTLAAGVLNLAFLVGGCLAFFHLLHGALGLEAPGAAGLAALAWAPVPIWRSALVPFSEPLFLLLLTLALVLACRSERRGSPKGDGARGVPARDPWPWETAGGLGLWLSLVLALLAAIHVRTVGVAVAAAVVVVLLAEGRRRAAGTTAAVVGGGMLPWVVWTGRAHEEIPGVLRDVLGSYGPWLLEQIAAYPEAYLAGLHTRALDIVDRVLTVLLPVPPSLEPWVDDFRLVALVVFLPAFFLGLDRIWSRSRVLVLFLFLYVTVVWLWPFEATRLLVPLVPVLMVVVIAGFLWSRRGDDMPDEEAPREPIPPKVVRGWRGVGVGWIALFSVATAWNLATGWAGAGYRINSRSLARTVTAVEEATPPGAVVGAPEFWAAIPLHSDRISAPSARFLPVRSRVDEPSWGTPGEQHRIWALTGIDHLVLEQGGTIHGEALDALVEACGPTAVQGVASWPGGRLVRIGWDADCRRSLGVP